MGPPPPPPELMEMLPADAHPGPITQAVTQWLDSAPLNIQLVANTTSAPLPASKNEQTNPCTAPSSDSNSPDGPQRRVGTAPNHAPDAAGVDYATKPSTPLKDRRRHPARRMLKLLKRRTSAPSINRKYNNNPKCNNNNNNNRPGGQSDHNCCAIQCRHFFSFFF